VKRAARWSEAEVQQLRDLAPKASVAELTEQIGRSEVRLRQRLSNFVYRSISAPAHVALRRRHAMSVRMTDDHSVARMVHASLTLARPISGDKALARAAELASSTMNAMFSVLMCKSAQFLRYGMLRKRSLTKLVQLKAKSF
jgi:hypothetical protein